MSMKKMIVITILAVLFPMTVHAADSAALSCSPSSIQVTGEVTCTVTLTTDLSIINAFEATIVVDEGLSVTSDKMADTSNWAELNNNEIDSAGIISMVGRYTNSTVTLGTFKVKANSGTGAKTIKLTSITWGYTEGTSASDIRTVTGVADATSSITVTEATTPPAATGLSDLTATGGILSPLFSESNTGYMLTLSSSSTTTFGITGTPKNNSETVAYYYVNSENAEVAITDHNNITFATSGGNSDMSIKIKVGTVTYTVSVTKPAPTGTDGSTASNELSSLTVGGINVALVSGTYYYEVTLASVNEYQVHATLKDSEHFEIQNLTLPTTMSGETEFAIIVAPKSNTTGLSSRTYTVKVKKGTSTGSTPGTSSGGGTSSGSSQPSVNPRTGGATIFMALLLAASFGVSIYLYRRNAKNYN